MPTPDGCRLRVAVGKSVTGGSAVWHYRSVTQRRLAGATAALAAFLTALTIGYLAYAVDPTNRNGGGLTIVLALALFGTPATAAWWFASKLWKAQPPK